MLSGEKISKKDFDFAHRDWKEFSVSNMVEFHDLYLKGDTVLLADVFEEFRKTCKEHYDLHPVWYFSAPGLSWDALLKHSGVELELLSDPDMLLFFEEGTRGGISSINHRYSKANNKYLQGFLSGRRIKVHRLSGRKRSLFREYAPSSSCR